MYCLINNGHYFCCFFMLWQLHEPLSERWKGGGGGEEGVNGRGEEKEEEGEG